ncbi:uncharacterized protein LOC123549868 [Mercenaria mercenaria]|uniref:uncharacterized protein LOC123549868 n=1 Tax=Mercenaria mercenaria TaxID=6596 RepID=UPI00234F7C66|nr:uncharacterized protein LOC123549868 [Mercenaria mercenaria]
MIVVTIPPIKSSRRRKASPGDSTREPVIRKSATGQYDVFASLHSGIVVISAHFGPNFNGWHRCFLALFEEALRRIIPWLSLPYLDPTLEYHMHDPVDSIIWTKNFLGNGDGRVRVGPFANWMAPGGHLTRNIGGRSRLISSDVIRRVLTRCHTSDIVYPTAKEGYNVEKHHSGQHLWIGGHMSERPMDRFPQYRNLDGYSNFWTKFWYRYERSPSCSLWQPFCGSQYLRCDMSRQICLSITRKKSAHMKCTMRQNMAQKERKQKINIITRPPSRDPVYKATSFDGRSSHFRNGMFTGGFVGVKQDFKSSMPVSKSKNLLPIPDYHETSTTIQNTFELNGHADVTKWVFIPVNVTYRRNQGNQISTLQHNISPNKAKDHSSKNSKTCVKDEAGAMKVGIQSSGLNYDGEYFGYTLIDRHLPVDSATTYIGIKSPEVQYTEVILSAVHSCGTMCQAYCLIPESEPAVFKPCFGFLKISSNDLTVYGRTYEEAVSRFMLGGVFSDGVQNKTLRIFFDCSHVDNSQ